MYKNVSTEELKKQVVEFFSRWKKLSQNVTELQQTLADMTSNLGTMLEELQARGCKIEIVNNGDLNESAKNQSDDECDLRSD